MTPCLSPQYMTKHKCDFSQMTLHNEEWHPRLSPQCMTKHKCDFWQMTHPNEEWPPACPHNTWQNINVIFDKWHSIMRSDTPVCPHNAWQNINVIFDKWHTNLCMFSNVGHVPKDIMTLVLAKITFTGTNIVYIESRTNACFVCLCLH